MSSAHAWQLFVHQLWEGYEPHGERCPLTTVTCYTSHCDHWVASKHTDCSRPDTHLCREGGAANRRNKWYESFSEEYIPRLRMVHRVHEPVTDHWDDIPSGFDSHINSSSAKTLENPSGARIQRAYYYNEVSSNLNFNQQQHV